MGKNIEVLLREHVDTLGRCGDVVNVRSGYARNFLFPKKFAVPATDENRRVIARRAARIDAEEAAQRESLAAVVEALNALTVTTAEKADDDGRLYGSVNAARIAELCKAAGCEVEEGKVRLEHPLKEVGEHKVAIHLFADLTAEVTVVVEAEA
mgnify:CR=1 FL=1|jgi:large subunit ribosomal protein L9